MHFAMLGSIARRGLDAHASFAMENPQYKMPMWGIALLTITAALYLFTQFMVEYTYGRILPTLLMIESPRDAILFEPIPAEDEDPTNKAADSTRLRQPFLTSSFRATTRLLQSKGGFRSRFRGISVFAVNLMAVQLVSNIIGSVPLVPRSIVAIGATVLCANLSLAWTHIVISEPSPKTWINRVSRSTKVWRKVALPTTVFAVAQQAAIFAPLQLAYVLMGDQINNPNIPNGSKKMLGMKGLAVFLLAMTLSIFLVIPANVMLTRVQTSILDDTEETIVPLDRSFGGKLVPELVGGTGVLSMADALKTFDWNARKRLLIAYAKVFAMQLAVTIFFSIGFVTEIFIIVGKDWNKLVPQDPPQGKDSL